MFYQFLIWLAAFALAASSDCLYAKYTLAVISKRPLLAAACSGLLPVLGLLSIYIVIDHIYAIVPTSAGHFIGTYLIMKAHYGRSSSDGKSGQE